MNPHLRQGLIVIMATALSVWMGIEVADGSYFWPGLASSFAIAAILARVMRLPFDVILTGMVAFGYIVGNRGFAQIMPAPGVPLLPAEIALMVATAWRVVLCAFSRRMPFQQDLLNWTVVALLVLGSGRFVIDFPRFGLSAARDFAMVYYATFFLLVQHMANEPRARQYLRFCILVGLCVLPVAFGMSLWLPGVFANTIVLGGVPIFFYKGDLVFTFFAVGTVWLFLGSNRAQGKWALPLALVLFAWIGISDNRSSLMGLLCVLALLALARRWRLPLTLGAMVALGLCLLGGLATLGDNAWAQTKLHGMADRIRSVTDLTGTGTYQSEESYFKGHNNRFRAIWWKNVILDTWDNSPVFGLGFGSDLARGFLQEYYPDAGDEFTTRSPHNIFITFFGRMGFLGLLAWSAFCAVVVQRTWRALRRDDDGIAWAYWCGALVVLVSGTFGVVLEGPMGALPFWVSLGLASAHESASTVAENAELAEAEAAKLETSTAAA